MKHVICTALLAILFLPVISQNLKEYKASNGITYHPDDTVKLGRGSAPNGTFLYVQVGGLAMNTTDADKNNLARNFAGTNAVIKRITKFKRKGAEIVYFAVGVGLLTNYYLYIEDAIATCEIVACKNPQQATSAPATADKFDQLKKLKALKDEGVLSEEEYNAEKKKLLDQ